MEIIFFYSILIYVCDHFYDQETLNKHKTIQLDLMHFIFKNKTPGSGHSGRYRPHFNQQWSPYRKHLTSCHLDTDANFQHTAYHAKPTTGYRGHLNVNNNGCHTANTWRHIKCITCNHGTSHKVCTQTQTQHLTRTHLTAGTLLKTSVYLFRQYHTIRI